MFILLNYFRYILCCMYIPNASIYFSIGVSILAVGVSNADVEELSKIAAPSSYKNIFYSPTFDDFPSIEREFIQSICSDELLSEFKLQDEVRKEKSASIVLFLLLTVHCVMGLYFQHTQKKNKADQSLQFHIKKNISIVLIWFHCMCNFNLCRDSSYSCGRRDIQSTFKFINNSSAGAKTSPFLTSFWRQRSGDEYRGRSDFTGKPSVPLGSIGQLTLCSFLSFHAQFAQFDTLTENPEELNEPLGPCVSQCVKVCTPHHIQEWNSLLHFWGLHIIIILIICLNRARKVTRWVKRHKRTFYIIKIFAYNLFSSF